MTPLFIAFLLIVIVTVVAGISFSIIPATRKAGASILRIGGYIFAVAGIFVAVTDILTGEDFRGLVALSLGLPVILAGIGMLISAHFVSKRPIS